MKSIYYFLIIAMIATSMPLTFGQGNSQKEERSRGHKETMKAKEKVEQSVDSLRKKIDDDRKQFMERSENKGKEDKEQPNSQKSSKKSQKDKGNALGKDKDGMSGREFGQQRANEAR